MKKIFVFIDWYLPGYKAGGPIRSLANLVSALKSEYCFYIVCRNTDYLEIKPYKGIKHDDWNQLSENEFVYYISEKNLSIKKIRKFFQDQPEIVYINGIYSFYFSIVPLILAKKRRVSRIIVAPRGMFSTQAFSSKRIKKRIFIILASLMRLYNKITLHATDKSEESDIRKLKFRKSEVIQIPNLPPKQGTDYMKHPGKEKGQLKMLSIARISPEKNTLFALQVLSNKTYVGSVFYDIYGPVYDKTYWKKCTDIISSLPENIKVDYKGPIQHADVFKTIQEYHFYYLPTKGENFGHGIMEALMAGCPVIISNKTPWQNLEEHHSGWDLVLDETIFARVIQKCIEMGDEEFKHFSGSALNFSREMDGFNESMQAYKLLFG